MAEPKILIVEDDRAMIDFLTLHLEAHGYQLESTATGERALTLLARFAYDLVILDVQLAGGLNGFDMLTQMREASDVPVIILTGTEVEDEDRVRGLDLMADAYLIKPIGGRVLRAEVAAVLRRAPSDRSILMAEYRYDSVTIDIASWSAFDQTSGRRVRFTKAQWAILRRLLQTAGRPVDREVLLQTKQGRQVERADLRQYKGELDSVIYRLRAALRQVGVEKLIMAVRGSGFMIRAPDPVQSQPKLPLPRKRGLSAGGLTRPL